MEKQDAVSIREWEEFLSAARRAGATDDTMVVDEVYDHDPDIHIGFKVDLTNKSAPAAPEHVAVPTSILHDLLYVARTVANDDGDAHGLGPVARGALAEFNEHFLAPVLGPDPWAAAARAIAKEDADKQSATREA
jgi:hypothetical protein